MSNRKPSLSEQTKQLADAFPIGCKVRVMPEDVPGRVDGYREGANIRRPGEMALIVGVPADRWILYPDQVERVKEVNV